MLSAMEEKLEPYTMEEINAMIDESERQLANGQYRDIEELFREWDEEERLEDERNSYIL